MPTSRIPQLFDIAEDNGGFITSKEAREVGISNSVMVRLMQRGQLERSTRGVYRLVRYPFHEFGQYREALLWVESNNGPKGSALSHETALALMNLSDANPSKIHLTIPADFRLRKETPGWIELHRAKLAADEVTEYEGLRVTSVSRSILDVAIDQKRTSLARQAIDDAAQRHLLTTAQARNLNKIVTAAIEQQFGG